MDKDGVVKINSSLYTDIKEYCSLNGLKINSFINELLEKQFAIEKFGDAPFFNYNKKNTSVDTSSEKDKTVITVIDTKSNEIVEQKEVEKKEDIQEIVEKYEEKTVPEVPVKKEETKQSRPKRTLK